MNILELTNVTKRFGTFAAVDNISFTVQKGKIVSLLGPSGCGKTTTLRLISGFEDVDEGSISHGNNFSDLVKNHAKKELNDIVIISAEVESQIAELADSEDKLEILKDLGLNETTLNKVIKTGKNVFIPNRNSHHNN